MPFKSKAQERWAFAAEKRGDFPAGRAEQWAHETPNLASLPERKKPRRRVRTEKDLHGFVNRMLDGYHGGQ